jgi:hypothetical protein
MLASGTCSAPDSPPGRLPASGLLEGCSAGDMGPGSSYDASLDASPRMELPLDGSVVKMKGLPFKAGSEDVLKFYVGFSIKASSIYMKRHPDGRPSGEVRWSTCKSKRCCFSPLLPVTSLVDGALGRLLAPTM